VEEIFIYLFIYLFLQTQGMTLDSQAVYHLSPQVDADSVFCFGFGFAVVLEVELRALHSLGRYSAT
jgi:hypothetical protein